MTRDDIIRMAREAGCIPVRPPEYDNDVPVFAMPDDFERFAALVRADEREECAKVCETFYNHEAHDCAEAIRARTKGEKNT
jgi:hypothetical protein